MTGLGLVTGLGMSREATWRHLREGRSAARFLDLPAGGGPPFVGCPVPHSDHRQAENLFKAAMEAAADARLREAPFDPHRGAAVIGLSKGDVRQMGRIHAEFLGRISTLAGRESSLSRWPNTWPCFGSHAIGRVFNLLGPRLAPVAACATGVVAAWQAAELIRRGACDVALAGSGDASLHPFLLGAFRTMRALARCPADADPARAARPWDRARSGFVVGEGAAVLVLERADHARARGVLPYAELAGGALGSDAAHPTDLDPDPTGLALLIGRALDVAATGADEVDYANVHGTATRANDPLECRALRRALGPHAEGVSCSANKAQIGHLLGAAGSAELAITCLAIRDGFVPPTVNLDSPDPACDLDGTPHVGRARPIRAALKLSLGFGGHLAAVVLRRPEGARRGPGGPPDA